MENRAEYIKKVEIIGLWSRRNITWNLNRDVNILSGINGSGKSTIIQSIAAMFKRGRNGMEKAKLIDSIEVEFDNGLTVNNGQSVDSSKFNIDVISTFDGTFKDSETMQKIL